jgi:peptidoglycan hydrolase-like protein with peptidoglycan-binding domain
MSRRFVIPMAAVALAAAAGGTTWAASGRDSGSNTTGTASTSTARATATIARRDLVQHETVDGTLGYADADTLYAQAMGTVTALREAGTVVERGQALYWLGGEPVTLMYGRLPMWRRLDRTSAGGRDIRQLERNLVALGYDPDGDIDVDDEWDSATTSAVKRWQKDKGLQKTGSVELGQVAFLPGPRRIGQLKTTAGALLQPGSEVVETSSTRRAVTVDLDADKQALVKKGDKVEVELPDGSTVTGRIVTVGKAAESEADPQSGEEGEPTIPLEIRLPAGVKTGGLDETPVDVSLEQDRAENALTVPVSALLALAEGGYAVEVVDPGGSTHLVRVEPGMYADGLVEIRGKGLKKGMKVVVPE